MIIMQNIYKDILAQGGDDGEVVSGDINTKVTCIIYIDYTKGDEDNLTITFDAYVQQLDDFFPLMYEDTSTTVTRIKKELSDSGKYRLVAAVGENEKQLRVNAQFANLNGGNAGTATVTIVPVLPMI